MKSLRYSFAVFTAACLMSVAAFAADANGTWKWTQQGGRGGGGGGQGGGQPRESTLELTAKDGHVTGKLTTPGFQGGAPVTTEIKDGTIKGDEIAFTVEREFNGNKFVSKYTGKLEGDTITGKSESPGRDGQTRSRDWVAKRAGATEAKPAADAKK